MAPFHRGTNRGLEKLGNLTQDHTALGRQVFLTLSGVLPWAALWTVSYVL